MHESAAEPAPVRHRPAPGLTAEVCIVGAGFTGLWAAYRILTARPDTRVVVLEQHQVGFGASGRNAGWVSALLSANRHKLARQAGGHAAVVRFQKAMFTAVDEILEVLDAEGICADQRKPGHLRIARTPAAVARLAAQRESFLAWGYDPKLLELQDRDAVAGRIAAEGTLGGMFDATTAVLDPAKAVRGLAGVVEGRGASIHESTTVARIEPGRVILDDGATVQAQHILVCTEAYSETVDGLPSRRIVPVNSSLIMTTQLSAGQWAEIGWDGNECFGDAAHVFTYGQRTTDGRIALGGRGKPYRYASGTGGSGEVGQRTVDLLQDRLHSYFPALAGIPLEHAWSGVIGVTRDWCAFVDYDPATRIGSAGGYAGHGVTSAYVAANTMVDRMLGIHTTYADLPWFGYRPPRWEPEPLRWVGITGMYALFGAADAWEEHRESTTTSLLARIGGRLTGVGD